MFCEGKTIMTMARALKVTYQSVRTWIKKERKKLKNLEGKKGISE